MHKEKVLPKVLDEHKLRDLYENQLLTDLEIAKMLSDELGLSRTLHENSIAHHRKRWGIETITIRQRREKKEGRSGPSLDQITPAILNDLYSQMGDRQIAKMYGVSKPSIKRLRKLWGIEAISKTERSTSVETLTDEQKDFIIGCMFGDGHLLERGVFKVSHAYHQYEYLKKIREILHPIAKPIRYGEKKMKESGEIRGGFSFVTEQHIWLKALRKLFYPKGKRIFPRSFLDSLSERSLAFWYFDDGSKGDNLPSFALGDVGEEGLQAVLDCFRVRFGFDVYCSPRTTPTCQIVAFRSTSAGRLFEIVAPYATPDMLHKIPERYWPKGVRPIPKIRTSERIPIPKDLGETGTLEDFFAFWRKEGFPFHISRPEDIRTLSLITPDQILHKDTLKARQVGQSSCQAFMPHIWESYNQNSSKSPKEMFDDDDVLRKTIQKILDRGETPNSATLRRELRYSLSGVYNFRPSVAKILVDRYCREGGIVYDPCGGWGGRMMGALLSSAKAKYIACEPSTQSFQGLHELSQWIDRFVPGARERVELNCIPAEEFDPPQGLDMVLTSPPYWCQEHYADEETQSSYRYRTYGEWLDKFWRVVISRSVQALAPGGWIVLNVDDFIYKKVKYNLVEDTISICSELGLGHPEKIKYDMPSPNKQDNHEWVLVWCRSGAILGKKSQPPIQVQMPIPEPVQIGFTVKCEECGKKFHAARENRRFCGDNCGSRSRRRRSNKPRKEFRTVTCSTCEKEFHIPLTGGVPKNCPRCAIDTIEAEEIRKRTKVCHYRHCGREFMDYSRQNSEKFCHIEHRRREKLLREGKVSSVQSFRKPDPVLSIFPGDEE